MKENITEEQASGIQALIKMAEQLLLPASAPPPHDYSTLKEQVMQNELRQETTALKKLLTDKANFKKHFKERCKKIALMAKKKRR